MEIAVREISIQTFAATHSKEIEKKKDVMGEGKKKGRNKTTSGRKQFSEWGRR